MNLWEIQPHIVELLQNAPRLDDVPVLADDGTYPKTPQREEALRTKGLVLIVWQIESDGLIDVSPTGLAIHGIYVPVVIEENVTANRASTGLKLPAEKALQYVLETVSGRPQSGVPNESFVPMDPPFKNFGRVNGVNRIVINFLHKTVIVPA